MEKQVYEASLLINDINKTRRNIPNIKRARYIMTIWSESEEHNYVHLSRPNTNLNQGNCKEFLHWILNNMVANTNTT